MKMFEEYNQIFKLDTDKLPVCDLVKVHIQLKTDKPIYQKQYALEPVKGKQVSLQIEKWLKEDIIGKSDGTRPPFV